MTWTAGYNNSVAYTAGYYHDQSPSNLNACLTLQRVAAPSLEKFTYCELGFGLGLTSLILAATHPTGDFYAFDFNPLHVLAASSVKTDAGLTNLTILENSFGELASGAVDLPALDYITMHGILSWVSDETRAHIVKFLARYLKPGGVVQVSYNAMVGCAQILPLQRLLMEHAGEKGDDWTAASALAKKMVSAGSAYFGRNGEAATRVNGFATMDSRYLVHEYLHEKWTPFHFTDIARELGEAKLTYAGSTRVSQMAPVPWLSDEQNAIVDAIDDPIRAEELRDYFANRAFRSDIFVRGKVSLNPLRLQEQAAQVHLWAMPGANYATDVSVEPATVTRGADFHRALCDLLRQPDASPDITLASLFHAPAFKGLDLDGVLKLVRLSLVANETALRFGAIQPRAAADRLNAVLLSRAERGEGWQALASPRLGGGAGVSGLDQLLMAGLNDKPDRSKAIAKDLKDLVARVTRSLQITGLHLEVGGEPVGAGDLPKRIGHMLTDSGARLINHGVQLGVWTEAKGAVK